MTKLISSISCNDSYKTALYYLEMSKEIGKRIEEKLQAKNGGNQSELARFVGVTPQAVQQWISGDTAPKGKNLEKVANFLGVSRAFLSYGVIEGKPANMSVKGTTGTIVELVSDRKGNDFYVIPQYDTRVAMGSGLLLPDQPGVIQSWHVSKDWIKKNVRGYQSTMDLCIVTGFGDSMRPLFNPGDPLLIDASVNTVETDSIYFFRVDDEGFIKRLQRIPGEGIRVLSANRDSYEPWTIKPNMDFQILGRVLKVWCSEDF